MPMVGGVVRCEADASGESSHALLDAGMLLRPVPSMAESVVGASAVTAL